MDRALYKAHTISRGITYAYYFSPPKDKQHTILFLHGFPSTSYDWHKQVAFFVSRGYGVLAPDMLGYGGTDKPPVEELDKYIPTFIAEDLVELLEKEKVGRAVAIGHDWYALVILTLSIGYSKLTVSKRGSMANSRVAQLHSDRFDGFGFLALGYCPPNPDYEVHAANAKTKEMFGYELYGYQIFHSRPDAADIIEAHVCSNIPHRDDKLMCDI
jgi:soluble epoxide hydrolase / lipid-phosphate phosphatase